MLIGIIGFTRRGCELAVRLATAFAETGDQAEAFGPQRFAAATGVGAYESVDTWTRQAFCTCEALVFVGACGIAVRSIAPHVHDKMSDPAVVSVDEAGQHAIALLSGHVGGANALARRVARLTGGQAVVSTATDVNGCFAVDEWAAHQGLVVVERELAKELAAALLEDAPVGFASDMPIGGTLPAGLIACDATGAADASRPRLGALVSLDATKQPFAQTLHLVPRAVTVGVGCKRATTAAAIAQLVERCLEEAQVAPQAVAELASIDVKATEEGLLTLARERGWRLRFHAAEELAAVAGSFHSSAFVQQTVGVDNVCERAACACGERLLLPRRSTQGVTVALAVRDLRLSFDGAQGARTVLSCVGLGPGAGEGMTLQAHAALDQAEVIVGYRTYVELIRSAYPHKELVSTGMRGELERCRLALERAAQGQRVAVVCSGDPGVYGMAGLLLELAEDYPAVQVEVVPGVSAANGGAAVLGAPLMHDWCSISLSDLMTPWETIEGRLRAAAQADFCIVLYNPASRGRAQHLQRACDILLETRSPHTVCGVVRNIGRAGQASSVLTLAQLRDEPVDMLTCVFVGNSQTRALGGRMVTPRGYQRGDA